MLAAAGRAATETGRNGRKSESETTLRSSTSKSCSVANYQYSEWQITQIKDTYDDHHDRINTVTASGTFKFESEFPLAAASAGGSSFKLKFVARQVVLLRDLKAYYSVTESR